MFDSAVLGLPGARRMLVVLAVCSLAAAALAAGQAFSLAWALAGLWGGATLADSAKLLACFFACLAARRLVCLGRDALMDRYASRQAARLRLELAGSLYDGGPDAASRLGTGAAVTLLADGVDHVETYIALIVPKVAAVVVEPVLLVVALMAADWVSGVICLAVLPFLGMAMVLLGRGAREAAERRHDEYTGLANHFLDSLRGIADLRSFGRTGERAVEVFSVSERFREATLATLRTATLSSLALDLFATFALAAASILLGFRLMGAWIELAPALAALMLVPEFFSPIIRFAKDFHATLDGKNALAAITDAIDANAAMKVECPAPAGSPSIARVVMNDASCMYYATQDQKPALRDLSFSAAAPERIGIVGVSGAGKSTLANLLAGFSAPTSGTARFWCDDTAAFGIPLTDPRWLAQVTYIPQAPYVFRASLRDNVAFYRPDASDEEVWAACEAAGLADVARCLPDGLATMLGDGGRALSGGQAQRIALARAFLDGSRRRVLVFDEPTAHLDVETEVALKPAMLALMEGRLVFFATHRLHWMRDMDRILVLEDGVIAEQGTFDDLVERGGAFTRLVSALRGGDAA